MIESITEVNRCYESELVESIIHRIALVWTSGTLVYYSQRFQISQFTRNLVTLHH